MGFTAGYKLNAGTQYEFTVSNETISEAVQAEGGITEGDIAPYCYTALVDSRINSVFIQSTKNVNAAGFDSWQAENMPYYFIRDTRYVDSNTDINKNDVVYERNFLVWNGTIFPGTADEKTGTFLVMDLVDIKRWYVDFNAGMFIQDTFASEITEGGVTSTFPGYNGSGYTYISNTLAEPVIHCDNNDPMQNPEENLHVFNVLVINDDLWIGNLNPASHGDSNTGIMQSTYNQYVDSYVDGYLESTNPVIYQAGSDSWAGISEIIEMDYPDLGSRTTVYKSYVESSDGVLMEINGNSGGTFDVRTDSGSHCKDLNTLLKWQSWCGLKFTYDNIMYKPIVSQGVITGYTDDMDTPSEYDTMTNVTGNNISPVPPGPAPGPEGDEVDDMTVNPLFGLNSDAGFAAYFLMTASQLATLHTWLTTTTFPDGYDPYQYIISLIQFPMKLTPSWCLTGTGGNIVIGGEDTGISTNLIGTEQTWRGLGTFNIPRYNNNFLDYDPYTQYECYIPCCGWVTLPDIVAGREISVRVNYDLTDASIIGNVYVKIDGDSLLVASKSGMMGRQTIVSGEAQGVRSAQITSALLSAGTGALNVAAGAISGNAVATVSGAYHIVAGLAQTNIAANSSYARQIGSTGGKALLCQFDQCYIKITTTRAEVPANYGHTVGYVCNKSGKVSDFSDFTIFDNVDVSNIAGATERELQLIKRTLESGVIINKPSN